ncbi:hypothetical protein SNOG_00978 [Parastagonospora nodorum SN15]|uniref:ubiquitinyl hydrolase 1 n=1 Tax=Phaeosphaeria nodorum (strain SN15 / ATCC MYA-4574 / FGSC 10173) TaxID=321614 RepID=Q0V4T6_PHANO|nr:hypothetical protein SNOG_00978 [Parastagonospora nodorum SN15]EAT92473.2 hypothetical protein SNOG_00978 [Parastagonospora nodorum SN15]
MRAPVLAPAGFNHHQHQHTGHHHHQHGRSQHQHPHPHQNINLNISAMAEPYMASDEDMAHLQKLSSEYEPEATGPLVGERQSSAAITTEYQNADPIYRIKTAALPGKYAFFRTCRGDGHCGWRAIAFTYFEALLRVGDVNKFGDEEARLNSLGNLLDHIGYSRDLWIDFADGAFDLMRKLADSLQAMDGQAPDILLQTFNDFNESMSIITYVKLLASAWVQTHADEFRHFVPMGDVKAYCANNIEPTKCEADNIGIAALAEALIKPAGFGLEVWYLDRSPGEEINRSFYADPTDHQGMSIPNAHMLRLLYRPGHYDILYKAEDVPRTPPQQPVQTQAPLQVALANSFNDFIPMASDSADVMTMIPGMYPTGFGQKWASLSGGPFRPSMYELEPGFGHGMQVQPFQTSIFRK